MTEITYNHFGIKPDQIPQADIHVGAQRLIAGVEHIESAHLAPLTQRQRTLLNQVEFRTKYFVLEKQKRLGIQPVLINPTPETLYIEPEKPNENDIYKAGGYTLPFAGAIAVRVDEEGSDLLGTALLTAHETSHHTAYKEVRTQWQTKNGEMPSDTADWDDPKRIIVVNGLSRSGAEQQFMKGLEHGLSLMDMVDMYYSDLRLLFPKEAAIRSKEKNDSGLRNDVRQLNQTLFGPIDQSMLDPFIKLGGSVDFAPVLDVKHLKQFRLIQEVCRTLGYATSLESKQLGLSKAEQIQLGRDILERDRYADSTVGLKKVVQLFGKEGVQKIFGYDDHANQIDETMLEIREKQHALGIYNSQTKRA